MFPHARAKLRLAALSALVALPGAARAAMTWHWNATPSAYETEIAASMDGMVASWNAYSTYDYAVGAIYSSGTPTADAGYLGQIRFGGSRNYRVAMHEVCHWLGTGTVSQWAGFYRDGRWTGTYAYNLKAAYDGPGERQSGDTAHFWPYGSNQDSEGVDAPRMVGIVGAYRRDMDLAQGDRTIGIASGTYRLRNRQAVLLLDSLGDTSVNAPAKQTANGAASSQQWVVTLVAGTQFFSIRNVATGRYLDSLGAATDGAPVVLTPLAGSAPVDSQLWQIVATDSFFFRLVNKATGRVLDNLASSAEGAALVQSAQSLARGQQWTFLHGTLAQTAPELGVISQGRPVTSSSAETAANNFDWKGNNGVAGDRWTASTNTYPQWWRVDLGSVQPVTKVAVDWFGAPTRTYRYRIEVSNDDATWTVALDKSANTQPGVTVDTLSGVNARYVRVQVVGASAGYAAFTECRVYNEAVPMRLVSQHRPTTASSEQVGNNAVNANDVDAYFTRWTAAAPTYPQWWQVDLGAVMPVNKAVIEWFNRGSRSYQYRIEGSNDGVSFTTLVDRTGNTSTDTSTDTFNGSARYVRVVVTGASTGYAAFYDAQIYTATGPVPPSAPASITATPASDRINLSWPAVADATSYTLKRATSAAGPFSTFVTQAGTTFADTTATPGVPYYYAVSAANAVGSGSDSSPVVAFIPAGLRVKLPFDESSGVVANDVSGFGWHGALLNGPLWTTGKTANSVDLDGADDYVSLPAGVLAGLNDFTISAWVYPDAISTWARVFDFGGDTTRYMFLCPSSADGTLRFAITNSGNGAEQRINAPAPLAAGVWTHVAVTLSGNTGTLYVNGTAVATNTAMTLRPSSLGATGQNWIGRSQWPDPYFNGRIDDFRLYDRALTASEVSALTAPPLTAVEEWRQEHFGSSANSGDAADDADPDGDGWTNAQEYAAGTSPVSRADALVLALAPDTAPEAAPGELVVRFSSVSGKHYRLERSETLAAGSWETVVIDGVAADAVPGTGEMIELRDESAAALPRRFYRVVLVPAP